MGPVGMWDQLYTFYTQLMATISPSTTVLEEAMGCYEGNPAACANQGEQGVDAAFQALEGGSAGEQSPPYWCQGFICRPTF
jgi:hypothetical protein